MLKRTCLYETHRALGAKLVEFGGWEMPLMYRGIVDEHLHTRRAASIFDVSHMGRLLFRGPAADEFIDLVCTRNCAKLAVGRCGYAHVCEEKGGILDDVIVSRAADHWLMVCNASNRPKLLEHFARQMAGRRVELDDQTEQTAMLAIQGPETLRLLREHVPIDIPELKRYAFATGSAMGMTYYIFRTGYTGEDGLEVVLPASSGEAAWQFITQPGEAGGATVLPAGLGARDTLRLEAGMPLYGHELGEEIDPISAACGWAVDLSKEFIGAAALRRISAEGPARTLVGL
ncbi:MAG: glycine cleavage system aminomethyltransferase GcvT, partial [Phycisphaerae bacterium]